MSEEGYKTPAKHPVSVRLSDNGLALLRELSARLGLSQAATIEMALRLLSRKRAV